MSKKVSLFVGFIEISSKFVINYKAKIHIKNKCSSSAFHAKKMPSKQQSSYAPSVSEA